MKKKTGYFYSTQDEVIAAAMVIMESTMTRYGVSLTTPALVRQYLMVRLGMEEREIFCVLFLDNQNCLIRAEDLFFGTIDGASVHPREVVKAALKHNAAAVILAHNHPSGMAEPSEADRRVTKRLQDTLDLVEIRVLDHLVVSGSNYTSFAERGLM